MDDEDVTIILRCGICKKLLENPRYLSCLHSFCESCLRTWINQTNTNKAEGVTCSVCKTVTEFCDGNNLDSKDLVEHLPRNNFLTSLAEREKITSKNGQRKFCQPCFEDDGVEVEGTHWCQQCPAILCRECTKFHKKVKNLANHKVFEIADLVEHPEVISRTNDLSEICELHPDENLENYCRFHEEPCCVRCLVYKHKHCDDVIPIDQWVRETQNALEPSELLQELDKKLDEKRNLQKTYAIEHMNNEITKMRKEIDSHLDSLEQILRAEVDILTTVNNDGDGDNRMIFSRIYLQNLITKGTTIQLLTNMKRFRKLIEDADENDEDEGPAFYIEFDQHLLNLKDTMQSFGHVWTGKKKEQLQDLAPAVVTDDTDIYTPMSATESTTHTEDDAVFSEDNGIDCQEQPKTLLSPKLNTVRRSFSVDNIAVIEKKLKMFIDNHITKVHENDKALPRNYSETDPEITKGSTSGDYVLLEEKEPHRYAKVDKHRKEGHSKGKTNRKGHQKNNAGRHRSDDQSPEPTDVKMRHKRHNKTKKVPTADRDKEKLNALINNYLLKSDDVVDKSSPLSNRKSYYFSTPNIPSFAENDNEAMTDENEESDVMKRRNSLQRKRDDIYEPDYDTIDYERFKPFLSSGKGKIIPEPQSSSKRSVTENDKERKGGPKRSVTENDKDRKGSPKRSVTENDKDRKTSTVSEGIGNDEKQNITNNTNVDDVKADKQTKTKQDEDANTYQIYSPQSQIQPKNNEQSLTLPRKAKPTPKMRFFLKAKQKLGLTKKSGKYDPNRSSWSSMENEPVYTGTALYEEPIRMAAHEMPSNKTKNDNVYEEHFFTVVPSTKAKQPSVTEKSDDSKDHRENTSTEKPRDTNKETENKHMGEKSPFRPKGVQGGIPPPSFLGELKKRMEVRQEEDGEYVDIDQKVRDISIKHKQNVLPVTPKPKKPLKIPDEQTGVRFAHTVVPDTANNQSKMRQTIHYETSVVNDFDVQSGNTSITGGCFSDKGKLYLIDKNEKKLYIFKCDAECEDAFVFKESPWDATIVKDKLIAVTFPNAECIDIVDTSEMKIIKSLPVNESCFGIDNQHDNLIVRCTESIKIMDIEGTLIWNIRVQTDLYGYLACNEDKIYYTYKSSLICMDQAGTQLFVFENPDLKRAEGLALDSVNNVYVAGMDSNNILQISGDDGKQVKTIVSDLKSPKVIAFSETLDRFIVGYDQTSVVIYDLESRLYGTAV